MAPKGAQLHVHHLPVGHLALGGKAGHDRQHDVGSNGPCGQQSETRLLEQHGKEAVEAQGVVVRMALVHEHAGFGPVA